MYKTLEIGKKMFLCDGCGLCCQHIGEIKELKEFHNGDGVCIHLNKENHQCTIYETRPDVCRVEKMYDLIYHKEFQSKQQFYNANMNICKTLKEKYQEKLIFKG